MIKRSYTCTINIETRAKNQMNQLYFLLFAIIIGCSKAHQEPASNLLVRQWTFEHENLHKDNRKFLAISSSTGRDLYNGELDVSYGKWARVSSYYGPTLSEKMLVTWVSLQTTSGQAGSALSIKNAYQMVILMLLSMENIRLITGWQEACISGIQ